MIKEHEAKHFLEQRGMLVPTKRKSSIALNKVKSNTPVHETPRHFLAKSIISFLLMKKKSGIVSNHELPDTKRIDVLELDEKKGVVRGFNIFDSEFTERHNIDEKKWKLKIIDIDLENSIHTFHGGEEYKFIPVISSMEHHHEHKLKFREHDKSKIKNMVGNRAPAIDILVNGTLVKKNAWVNANESTEFNASATLDIEGDDLTFTWDFDDGDSATGSVVNYSFADSNKPYNVTLTVSDGTDEAIAVITINVHINN